MLLQAEKIGFKFGQILEFKSDRKLTIEWKQMNRIPKPQSSYHNNKHNYMQPSRFGSILPTLVLYQNRSHNISPCNENMIQYKNNEHNKNYANAMQSKRNLKQKYTNYANTNIFSILYNSKEHNQPNNNHYNSNGNEKDSTDLQLFTKLKLNKMYQLQQSTCSTARGNKSQIGNQSQMANIVQNITAFGISGYKQCLGQKQILQLQLLKIKYSQYAINQCINKNRRLSQVMQQINNKITSQILQIITMVPTQQKQIQMKKKNMLQSTAQYWQPSNNHKHIYDLQGMNKYSQNMQIQSTIKVLQSPAYQNDNEQIANNSNNNHNNKIQNRDLRFQSFGQQYRNANESSKLLNNNVINVQQFTLGDIQQQRNQISYGTNITLDQQNFRQRQHEDYMMQKDNIRLNKCYRTEVQKKYKIQQFVMLAEDDFQEPIVQQKQMQKEYQVEIQQQTGISKINQNFIFKSTAKVDLIHLNIFQQPYSNIRGVNTDQTANKDEVRQNIDSTREIEYKNDRILCFNYRKIPKGKAIKRKVMGNHQNQ